MLSTTTQTRAQTTGLAPQSGLPELKAILSSLLPPTLGAACGGGTWTGTGEIAASLQAGMARGSGPTLADALVLQLGGVSPYPANPQRYQLPAQGAA